MLQSGSFFKGWNRNETSTLIILFESESVLYDHSHPEHYKLEERDEAYSRILEFMQRIDPKLTLLQIKRKLQLILSKYTTEVRRKAATLASGRFTEKNYRPLFRYFDRLNFLNRYSPPYVWKYDFRSLETETSKESEECKNGGPSKLSSLDEEENNIFSDGSCNFRNAVFGSPRSDNSSPGAEAVDTSQSNLTNGKSFPRNKDLKAGTKLTKSKKARPIPSATKKQEPININIASVFCLEEQSAKRKARGDFVPSLNQPTEVKKEISDNTSYTKELTEPQQNKHNLSIDAEESYLHEPVVTRKSLDREDILGQYVASELKTLRENPLLYLQTKQAILEIVTNANFELLNPD